MIQVRLKIERRRGGGLRVWSDDAPGMTLSDVDPHKVLASLGPALGETLDLTRPRERAR